MQSPDRSAYPAGAARRTARFPEPTRTGGPEPVKAFLAVSLTPGTSHPAAPGPDPDVLDRLAGTGSATVHRVEHGWIAYTGPDPTDRVGDPPRGFTGRLTRSVRSRTADVDMAGIAAMLGDGASIDRVGLTGLLPP